MNISENGLKLIKSFEGCRLTAYKAVSTESFWTIGWGHYGPDVKKGQTITQAIADKMLVDDMGQYVNAVNGCLKVQVNQNQFDALVSFAYNCGPAELSTSTLLKRLNEGDVQAAADEFLKWNKSGGVILGGLVTRRKKERELFLTPVPEMKPVVPKPLSDAEVDFVLAVMGDHWYRMKGNKPVQDETHRIADRIRLIAGRQTI